MAKYKNLLLIVLFFFLGFVVALSHNRVLAWTSWTPPVTNGVLLTADMWNELANKVATPSVTVVEFAENTTASCGVNGVPVSCTSEGELGCVAPVGGANSGSVFDCYSFGERGDSCYLFCEK